MKKVLRPALPIPIIILALALVPAAVAIGGDDDEKSPAPGAAGGDEDEGEGKGEDGGEAEETPKKAPPDSNSVIEKKVEERFVTVLFPEPTNYARIIDALRRETNLNIVVSARAAFAAEGTLINLMARDSLIKEVLDKIAAKINATWEVEHGFVCFLNKYDPRRRGQRDQIIDRLELSYLEYDLRSALFENRLTVSWGDKYLNEALAELSEKTGIPFRIDEDSMLPDEFVSLRVREARAESVLQLLAHQVNGELVAEPRAIVVYKLGAAKKKKKR